MTWSMNDQEFSAVLALPGDRRYAYFIKRVVDWQQVWSLASVDGWMLAGDNVGHELVPVWPHPRFAAACAVEQWAGAEPQVITLSAWLAHWLPGILRDQRQIAVFPTPTVQGIVRAADRLKQDLDQELMRYE
jgi:hypothetical protein